MSINVDPELGEILGLLEHKITGQSEVVQKELDLEDDLRLYFERDKMLDIEQFLRILKLISIDPIDFLHEAFGRRPSRATTRELENHRLEMIQQLLEEYLENSSPISSLPQVQAHPNVVNFAFKKKSKETIDGVKDLALGLEWMMPRLNPADYLMLKGLYERLGTFEAAIQAIPDLLATAGSPEQAAWAMEHQRLLMLKPWGQLNDIIEECNLAAVLFVMELEIKSAHREDPRDLVAVHGRLKTLQRETLEIR